MKRTVEIDFVSDVVCPWCALGSAALNQAIANVADEINVQLTYKPFELNPEMPAEGEHALEHMVRKYGRTAEQVAARNQLMIERGREIGVEFNLEKRTHFFNTHDAHRLLYWAASKGLQTELHQALIEAYFVNGQNPSSHATLTTLAQNVGLNAKDALQILERGQYTHEVRQVESFYRERGISAVPAMILNQQHVVAGSQSVEFYEQAIRQSARITSPT
ncbi:DsbA family oxidoreductase [Pseudomonas sp. SWI6]|uniref:DsbA family oxidoreductase n=1 Tax=Pseudomonas TaxID=286 RepID=UPI0003C068FF|nr:MULTISPECIES: DsbA family oxidoreductase [Pseudomonas]AGZ35273.1 DSBA oxidoreductase [Pseudomonas sp. VLB120]AVD83259.1 DsbA family oxidoreductase [Pseudomonas sp. SWI6]MDT8921503.1 DsbA family oxidoreductase [Pseudomonas taiwanensis]MPS99128.1 DsbA family oxidoreductase [Pseudomonas sp.]WEZ91013.1 DsbA family oxidoreductase [Pseudomonas sp. NyZ480]